MASYFHIRVDAFHYNRTIAYHHGIGNMGILTDSFLNNLFRQELSYYCISDRICRIEKEKLLRIGLQEIFEDFAYQSGINNEVRLRIALDFRIVRFSGKVNDGVRIPFSLNLSFVPTLQSWHWLLAVPCPFAQ